MKIQLTLEIKRSNPPKKKSPIPKQPQAQSISLNNNINIAHK